MIWTTSDPLRPDNLTYSYEEITEFIVITRLSLYNQSLPVLFQPSIVIIS